MIYESNSALCTPSTIDSDLESEVPQARLVSLSVAAAELGEKPGTLRRWCREGMPHDKGGRGRGKATMVDVAVARQWADLPADTQHLMTLADELPRIMATAVFNRWCEFQGPDKRRLAGEMAVTWYICVTTLLDHLQALNPNVAEPEKMPSEIDYLEKIARGD